MNGAPLAYPNTCYSTTEVGITSKKQSIPPLFGAVRVMVGIV